MNAFERCPLTKAESTTLEELTVAAGGIGFMKETRALTDSQYNSLRPLKIKGYVMVTGEKYLVVCSAAAAN